MGGRGSGSRMNGGTSAGGYKIPISMVSVSDTPFIAAHGKRPYGRGTWAFDIGNDTVFFDGMFSDAKKKAIKEAARRGVQVIRVGS